MCIQAGSESGKSVWKPLTATHAISAPAAPPARDSRRLSANSPFANSKRPAPKAAWMTYCFSRASTRTSSRLATLKIQINKRRPTPPARR